MSGGGGGAKQNDLKLYWKGEVADNNPNVLEFTFRKNSPSFAHLG